MRDRVFLPALLAVALVVPAAAAADGPGFDPFAPSTAGAVDFSAFDRRVTDLEKRVAALEGKGRPAAPVSPDAMKVPAAMPAAAGPVCGCAGSACPTPGFCGGAGCKCGTASPARASVPAAGSAPGQWATPAPPYRVDQATGTYHLTAPPPGVAAGADPFAGCGPAGCGTTPATTARLAGTPAPTAATRSGGAYPAGTFIRVTGAVRGGGTEGCPNGRCPTAR